MTSEDFETLLERSSVGQGAREAKARMDAEAAKEAKANSIPLYALGWGSYSADRRIYAQSAGVEPDALDGQTAAEQDQMQIDRGEVSEMEALDWCEEWHTRVVSGEGSGGIRLAIGLAIFASYDSLDVSAEHDVIYAGPGPHAEYEITDEHKAALDDLGWHWDEQYESWRYFT